jgi:Ser/Thr protein kinase RdoA (MazF antagonist)
MNPDVFPVVHSVLDSAALRAVVEQAYLLGDGSRCELVLAGMNDTYLLATDSTRWIARVYRAGWRSEGEVLDELHLLMHLASRGIPVSLPIPTRDGSLLLTVRAPEGERHVVLFTYVPGHAPEWTNLEHCRKAGELLARIHDASEDFAGLQARGPLDVEYLIERPVAALKPFLSARSSDWDFLAGFAERLRARLDAVADRLDWGVCHGDFSSTGNFRVGSDAGLTVFDFDLCGRGWRVSDLAPMQRAAVGHKDRRIWRSFLSGYLGERHLSSTDLAAVPLFYAASRLWSTGMRASHVARWGALYMGDWYVDWQLKVLRRWEAAHGCYELADVTTGRMTERNT